MLLEPLGKLNVLQQRWLVCRLAALLILRSVGIFFTVFLSVYLSTFGRPTLAPNVLRTAAVFSMAVVRC
jgi:hypothetical protein